jgi:hypothetical protein
VKFGDGDVIMLDLDMNAGELRVERGGAEQLPTISGLTGSLHVCIAMFFNGASCELRELSLSGGHYKSPHMPFCSTPGLPTAAPAVSGVPRTSSVPRLALKDVGETPAASRETRAGDSAMDSMAGNGAFVLSGHALLSDAMTPAMVSGNARPSPRLASAAVPASAGPHRLLTPRTLALSEGAGMNVERPSPQGTPRTISSPRGSLASLCPAGIYPSPRYVSPRTPRSIQQPSPRKPEAVPATLTISQHKELDCAIRRVETLEEHLSVTLAENKRLQEALSRALGRGGSAEGELNGELDIHWDGKAGALPPPATGIEERPETGDDSVSRKSEDAAHASASNGKSAPPRTISEGDASRPARGAGPGVVSGQGSSVEAGTQVSADGRDGRDGPAPADAGTLLKHWELDWTALEKVCRHIEGLL